MVHPWRCRKGHGNRSEIPAEVQEGPRRQLILHCAEPGCPEHTAIFVGSSTSSPPLSNRRPRKTDAKK